MIEGPPQLTQADIGRLCVFLDFDGTLVDLAPTPDAIVVPSGLPDLLARLHDRLQGRLVLVSGREVSALERFLPDFVGDVFGAHGAEARRNGNMNRHRLVGSAVVAQVQAAATTAIRSIKGLTLETKATGAVIHYRAAPQAETTALAASAQIAHTASGMELHRSKMAFEIRPADASKAAAVETIMAEMPDDTCPVVIGDDVTDEEAMAVANRMGGFCIRVGDGETVATYRLPNPAAVIAMLESWTTEVRA